MRVLPIPTSITAIPRPKPTRLQLPSRRQRPPVEAGRAPLPWHVHDLELAYSVGFSARQPVQDALAALPKQAWRPARDPDGRPRDGAQVAELTRWMPPTLTGWPPGMRIIARRERPHPGAQLHITDDDGWRITVFATNTVGGRIADLEVRHRLRARAEDRIRGLKDTGMTNLPLQAFTKNQIWLDYRLSGLRTAHLDPTAGLPRPARPNLGTQTPATAVAGRGRAPDHHRASTHPASLQAMALDRSHHHRPPTPRRARLTPTHQHLPPRTGGPATQRRRPTTRPTPTTQQPAQPPHPSSTTKDRG